MPNATDRIVVQVAPDEKQALFAKASSMGLSLSELMRRGAGTYSQDEGGTDLDVFVTEIHQAVLDIEETIERAVRSCSESNARIAQMEAAAPAARHQAIESDETLRFVRESNARIAAMTRRGRRDGAAAHGRG